MQNSNDNQFFNKISGFSYQVNYRELKVEEIFVRFYNNPTDRYRPPDVDKFAEKLM
jgi:hypothetical protein